MNKLTKFVILILAASINTSYADNTSASMAQMQQQLQALQNSRDQLQAVISQNLDQLANINSQIKTLQTNMKQAQAAANNDGINWLPNAGQVLPKDAFVAAQNGNQNVYICQANYNKSQYQGGLYPGVLENDACVITYGGSAYTQSNYAILTSTKPLYWVDSSKVGDLFSAANSNPPWINLMVMPPSTPGANTSQQQAPVQAPLPPAVVGGTEGMHSIFICRANIGNAWYVGKLVSGNFCMIAVDGKEASWPAYQVLMTKNTQM